MGVNAHEDEHEHCRHCDDTCRTTTGRGLHWGGRGAYWLPGACQACAEAERIAEWLRHQRGIEVYVDTDGQRSMRVQSPATFADAIARGET